MQRINERKNKITLSFQKGSIKIGAVILLYSIIMTALFSVAFFWFQTYFNQMPLTGTEGAFYFLDTVDAVNIARTNELQVQADRVVTLEAIDTLYATEFTNRLPYMLGILSVIVLISALVLWTLIKGIQGKEMRHIVKKLESIDRDGTSVKVDPALSEVYDDIKQKFNENLEDYKRLNTYLSHEQKNTLAILRSQLEIDQKLDYVQTLDIVSSGIDDILTLSEVHDDTLETVVDLALECAQVCDSYKAVSDQIIFSFDENANMTIKAKPRWIYRAISNLIDNAIKFGNDKPIHVDVYTRKNTVIVCVKDEGIGIDAEKLDRIFNHRYRVGELNNDGYGIGLSLVQHVCNLCDGFVWVESNKAMGTTFYLSFKAYNGNC